MPYFFTVKKKTRTVATMKESTPAVRMFWPYPTTAAEVLVTAGNFVRKMKR